MVADGWPTHFFRSLSSAVSVNCKFCECFLTFVLSIFHMCLSKVFPLLSLRKCAFTTSQLAFHTFQNSDLSLSFSSLSQCLSSYHPLLSRYFLLLLLLLFLDRILNANFIISNFKIFTLIFPNTSLNYQFAFDHESVFIMDQFEMLMQIYQNSEILVKVSFIIVILIFVPFFVCASLGIYFFPRVVGFIAEEVSTHIQEHNIIPPIELPLNPDLTVPSRPPTPPPPYSEAISTVHFSAQSQDVQLIARSTAAQGAISRIPIRRGPTLVWYVKSIFPIFALVTFATLWPFVPWPAANLRPLYVLHSDFTSLFRGVSVTSEGPQYYGKTTCPFSFYFAMAAPTPKFSLERFSSGDAIEWDVFLRNFNCYIQLLAQDSTEKQKKGLLLCHLSGDAAQKAADFYEYVGDQNKTVDDLVKDLTNVFSPASSGDLAHAIWQNSKQEPTETIETWHTRCKMLYKRAFPDDTPDTSLHLIRHFIEFLHNPEYRPNVMMKQPRSYKDALTRAQEVVAAISVNNPRLMREAAAGAAPHDPAIKQEVNALTPQPSYPSQRPKSPVRNAQAAPAQMSCFFCNVPGHVMRDCALLSRARRMLQGDSRSNSAQRKRSFQSPSRPFPATALSLLQDGQTPLIVLLLVPALRLILFTLILELKRLILC